MSLHNNAVNVECEKTTTSLLDLHDFALLHVFGYLNFRDSINFAGTSKRLKSVGALHFTKYKRFDLVKYQRSKQPNKLPAKTILSHIGQHIKTLAISWMQSTLAKAVMDNCVNVTTLQLYYRGDTTSELEKWMQQLKLESLTIQCCSQFNEISVELEALKELHFAGGNIGLSSMQVQNILRKTTELDSLTVDLTYPDFNYAVFTKLPKLQCLDITIYSDDLVNLSEFLKMDVLTKFKLCLYRGSVTEYVQGLNSFLEILAEMSNLHELQLWTKSIDENTFRILKSFHVTSLGFYASYYVDHKWDERWMIHQLVEAQPNLKHLELSHKNLLIEHVDFVVKNLVKLETFSFWMKTEYLQQLDELRINEMLQTSSSRPMLTLLCMHSGYDEESGVKIELRFEQSEIRILQLDNECRADDSYFLTDRYLRVRFRFDWCGRELHE